MNARGPFKPLLATLVLLASPPASQAADWSRAGGDLFVRPQATADQAPEDNAVRIPAPRQPYDAEIEEVAARHGLDPKLIHALTLVESRYRPSAVSPAGAAGLTQLMPGTAAELGVTDRMDPGQNLAGGADYLARQLKRFKDLKLSLAAYNAGPSRVARLGRVPDDPAVERYVDDVLSCYLALAAGRTLQRISDCRTSSDQAVADGSARP